MSNASVAYHKQQIEITQLMSEITKKLAEHAVLQTNQPDNWSLAGDLTHVANQLHDINNFLGQ